MGMPRSRVARGEVADIALEALALAKGNKRPPSRQDVLDAIQMELAGKRYGNETIRVTPDGQVTVKLPAGLAHLANDKHGRYNNV